MKSVFARGTYVFLGLLCAARFAPAQDAVGSSVLQPAPTPATAPSPAPTVESEGYHGDHDHAEPHDGPHDDRGMIGAVSIWDRCCSSMQNCRSSVQQRCRLDPGCANCGNWFAGVGGLLMNRDRDDTVPLTFQDGNGAILLDTRNAAMQWSGGFETRLGRYFQDGARAVEGVYWGVFPSGRTATFEGALAFGQLQTPLLFDSLFIDPAGVNQPVAGLFAGAANHLVTRDFEIHNIELNLLGTCGLLGGCGGRCTDACSGACGDCCTTAAAPCARGCCSWLLGVRFLRFREDMEFAGDLTDTVFTGTADELWYLIGVENNLIGAQLGGRYDYCVTRRLCTYVGAKLGVYNNHIRHRQLIENGAGQVAEVSNALSPFDGTAYDIASYKDDFAMLGELDLGLNFRVTNAWSTNLGYRAVAVSGVALAPSQIPGTFSNIGEVRTVESNGELILHGAYAGATFNY